MTAFDDSRNATIGTVRVRGRAVTGDVQLGITSARDGTIDPLDAELARQGFAVHERFTVAPQYVGRGRGDQAGTTGGEAPAVLVSEASSGPATSVQIALVEDDGFLYFVRSRDHGSDVKEFEIPVGRTATSDRALVGRLLGRIAVRLVSVVAKKAGLAALREVEAKLRPYRLRSFTPSDCSRDPARLGVDILRGGPALLLLHGVNTTSAKGFRFEPSLMQTLHARYGGRIAAFDHPTLTVDPRRSAEVLMGRLGNAELHELDILAHSRGGLVARELLTLLEPTHQRVRMVIMAATPNNGTPLADASRIEDFLSIALNAMSLVPTNPVTDGLGFALEVASEVIGGLEEAACGVTAMRPDAPRLADLADFNHRDIALRAIATNFAPRSDDGRMWRAVDWVMDKAFRGEPNDLVVPTRSVYLPKGQHFGVAAGHRLVLSADFGVNHCTLWQEPRVRSQLESWLDPNRPVDAVDVVEADHSDPEAELEVATRTGDSDRVRIALAGLRPAELRAVAKRMGPTLTDSLDHGTAAGEKARRKGTVVLLPGIFGSQLRVANANEPGDGELVWPNAWALTRGRFGRLAYGNTGERVMVDGLVPEYAALHAQLVSTWERVELFAYDWRLGLDQLSADLEGFLKQRGVDLARTPVHFVGHSMGGLVARHFLSGRMDSWHPDGRLVQLGTPNWGSFSMVASLLGEELFVRVLTAGDVVHSKVAVLDVFRSFPSVYQLLPSPHRPPSDGATPNEKLFDEHSAWHKALHGFDVNHLREANRVHALLANMCESESDPRRFVFVAGDDVVTACRVRIEPSGHVSFGVTRRGDGLVPHDLAFAALGIDPGRTCFVKARHGDLASHPDVLRSLEELIDNGTAHRLATPPVGGGLRNGDSTASNWIPSSELDHVLGISVPTSNGGWGGASGAGAGLEHVRAVYLGGRTSSDPQAPTLRVRVVHGSMEQARYPVAAGRYKGIPIEGALQYLNERLDNRLRKLQDFDLLPQDAGTAFYVPALTSNTYPKGAIVIGLGEFGLLSATRLARAVERGVIQYALAHRGDGPGVPRIGVSSVLIGTPGRYGLSVEGSILAVVQGVARATARLSDTVRIHELEFIELYEGKAEEAARAIAKLAQSGRFSVLDVPVQAEPRIDLRAGRRPGTGGYEQTGAPWFRVMLELDPPLDDAANPPTRTRLRAHTRNRDHDTDVDAASQIVASTRPRTRTLRWVSLGRSAQADRLAISVPVDEIQQHVREAIQTADDSADTNITLFEMLFPNDAKIELDENDNLHLLVDADTAWIPWEVVTGRDVDGKLQRPLALRAGVLRQLKPKDAPVRRRSFAPIGMNALVIGDPPTRYQRLPGAADEAQQVADLLERNGFQVTRCIYEAEDEGDFSSVIRNKFFADDYRIIHIAAHGKLGENSKSPFTTGVVIGKGPTGELLTANHFEQRQARPDLVFLNCCHIGRADERGMLPHSELAADMSVRLMATGVRAVVAAGWAVDDRAAATFARSFYASMISGYAFGEAVGQARKECFDGRTNTWGAYQCYGDPDFQFYGSRRRSDGDNEQVLSEPHLIKRLEVFGKKAGDQSDTSTATRVADELRRLEAQLSEESMGAEVWEKFGAAYAEAGDFDSAVFCYQRAFDKETTSAKAIEQLVNLKVRLAAMVNRGDKFNDPRVVDVNQDSQAMAQTLCEQAECDLDALIRLQTTAERLGIRGSLYKRWATIRGEEPSLSDLCESRDSYYAAAELASCKLRRDRSDGIADAAEPDEFSVIAVYQACLAVQMAYVHAKTSGGDPCVEAKWFNNYLERLSAQRDFIKIDDTEGDYYERAQRADIDATRIIVRGDLVYGREGPAATIVDGFMEAFRVRSSARQRLSVEHHYRELAELLPEEEGATAEWIANQLANC